MDVAFLNVLRAEWRRAPPQRFLLAAFVGYKAPREFARTNAGAKPGAVSIASLQAMFPNGRL